MSNPNQQDHSSYFGRYGEGASPNEASRPPRSPPRSSGGYHRDSYSHPGRSEPVKAGDDDDEQGGAGWDVYADFNNAGPRYSQNLLAGNSDGYRPLTTPDTPIAPKKPGTSTTYEPQVELVTVPKLGAEWSAQELRDMTGSGKAEVKKLERKRKWNEWNRDQRGLFGSKWGYRKVIVWVSFILVIVTGFLLVFLLPRVPSFAFRDESPLNANGGDPLFQRLPANFTFQGALDLQVNTHSSFIPVHFNSLKAEIYSLETSALIATGSLGPWTFKAKTYTPILLPVTFQYEAINSSDTTWTLVYNACRNRSQYTGGKRPGLNMRLVLKMKILGLIPEHGASTSILDAACPIELPNSAG